MPRKYRPAKRRLGLTVPVSDALYSFLTWRDWRAAEALVQPEDSRWQFFSGVGPHDHQTVWQAIVDEAVPDWVEIYPGTRPESWWLWTAPALRRVSGRFTLASGVGRCWPSGLPFGEPDDWTDLPLVESEPAFLERHDLWLPGERDRVPAEAFLPKLWSFDLADGPHVAPDDDDEDDGNPAA